MNDGCCAVTILFEGQGCSYGDAETKRLCLKPAAQEVH
jgi:hypothetical protein